MDDATRTIYNAVMGITPLDQVARLLRSEEPLSAEARNMLADAFDAAQDGDVSLVRHNHGKKRAVDTNRAKQWMAVLAYIEAGGDHLRRPYKQKAIDHAVKASGLKERAVRSAIAAARETATTR